MRFRNTIAYILLIVLVNYGFIKIQPVILPGGVAWPPIALVVGFVFVVRDFAQREVGHYILVAMVIGAVLSYFMATPQVAVASALAFVISELVDWAVYSFTGKPLSQRILYSSLIGTPVDSLVFLYLIGYFSVAGVLAMTLSKMVGAVVVWWLVRRREMAAIPVTVTTD